MSELRTTHHLSVTDDMIDHLGHMNVRFYGVAARAGSDAMVRELGAGGDLEVAPVDVYTRHFREQHVGADLEVRSSVLDAGPGWLRLYHELANVESGDLAASFVHRLEARTGGDLQRGWPPAATELPVAPIPEHGRPRSIELGTDLLAWAPPLDDVVAETGFAMRHPRQVEPDETRRDGSYDQTAAPMLLWAGEPTSGSTGPVLHPGPNGELIGWATLENRMAINRLPRVGARIQSFTAVAEVHDKTVHRLMWAYDLDRRDLLVAFEVIDVALDTVGRRAVTIPDDLRADAEARLRPELLPR